MPAEVRVVVIGSGPTALAAALRLHELNQQGVIKANVSVFEAEDRIGGLASSITDPRGFTWDLGVHVTGASKYAHFLETIDDAVVHWNHVPRCVKASMRHVIAGSPQEAYVPYPVQDSTEYFPEAIRAQCQQEMEAATTHTGKCNNFAEFAKANFGATMTDLFIRPYNEKVWTVPLEKLGCMWVEGRVPKARKTGENREICGSVVFRYPQKLRGVGAVWARVAARLPENWLHFEAPVVDIDTTEKVVTIGDGSRHDYDVIISSIPIVELGRITKLAPAIPLRHSKVVLVGVGIQRPQPVISESFSWMYFPLPETVFYRCTFISNFNEFLTPNAALYWSVLCEIGIGADEDIDEEDLASRTVTDLITEGILDTTSVVIDRWMHVLPYGYPIPTLDRDEVLAKNQRIFEQHNIFSRGRFGSWKYEVANQDHSFTMGREVVDRIFNLGTETVHS